MITKIKWLKQDIYDFSSFKLYKYEEGVIKLINTIILSNSGNIRDKEIMLSDLKII